MEKNQKINCDVCSCEYNNKNAKKCELQEIKVSPCEGYNTGNPEDESMCASYKCNNNNPNK